MGTGFLGIANFHPQAISRDHTAVPRLPTGLGVERRAIQHQHNFLALRGTGNTLAILENGKHSRIAHQAAVTQKRCLPVEIEFDIGIHFKIGGRAGALALGVHRRFKAIHIQRQVLLTGDIRSEVNREPIGVIEAEDRFTGNLAALEPLQIRFENTHALIQRFGKLLFFRQQRLLNLRLTLTQLRVSLAHFRGQSVDQFVEERAFCPQLIAVARRAANDTAQHVTAPLIGGQHTIANEECAGADMVCNHPQ